MECSQRDAPISDVIALSAHLSMLFGELPYVERPAAARAAGFSAVETWWPSHLIDPWVAEVQRLNLRVALLNSPAGDIEAGERGFLNQPDRRDETVREFQSAVGVAQTVGAPRINVLAGLMIDGVSRKKQLAETVATLRECAVIAAAANVTIVVEQINRLDVPRYLVPTGREVIALIEAVGSSSVRMLYDAYHAARSGRSSQRGSGIHRRDRSHPLRGLALAWRTRYGKR